MKVIAKDDGLCPACKKNIGAGAQAGPAARPQKRRSPTAALTSGLKLKMPARIICAIAVYSLALIFFVITVFQFEFDILSFVLIAAACFFLFGIVSLVARKRWSRKYNIVLQLIIALCGISFTAFGLTSKFVAGPGLIPVLAALAFLGWVTIGFIQNKKVIVYLDGDTGKTETD
jgi:hypothetical protein